MEPVGEDSIDFQCWLYENYKKKWNYMHKMNTKAITKRDHTPQQLLFTKQINVTGMQNKWLESQLYQSYHWRWWISCNGFLPKNYSLLQTED